MLYNWQKEDWPHFSYELSSRIEEVLFILAEKMGRVGGTLKGLHEKVQQDAIIDLMLDEALKTSEIEGEQLSRSDVKSSLRNQLGFNTTPEPVQDVRAQGIAELMVTVRNSFREKLTKKMLCEWHRILMQGQDYKRLLIGAWRKGEEPMQIVSGPAGKRTVHFEAPPSERVPDEMRQFVQWFNDTAPGGSHEIKRRPVRAAIVHLYFESIHPFDDGNGRIGRALSEKALSQGLGRPVFLSLSKTIEANKKAYYKALKEAQRSNEITSWIISFIETVLKAQEDSEATIEFVLQKTRYFDRYSSRLNQRQLKVIRRMLSEGPEGFEGEMSARKYTAIAKVSKATATRDLQYLAEIGAMTPFGGGRSTQYKVNL